MDVSDQTSRMRVAASMAGKWSVELAMEVSDMAADLGREPAYMTEINRRAIARKIAAIRSELSDLEHLIEGREPPIEMPPRAA